MKNFNPVHTNARYLTESIAQGFDTSESFFLKESITLQTKRDTNAQIKAINPLRKKTPFAAQTQSRIESKLSREKQPKSYAEIQAQEIDKKPIHRKKRQS